MKFVIKDFEALVALGVYPIETRIKNKVLITLEFNYPTDKAEVSDKLEDTIDYDTVVATIDNVINKKHYNLIEHFLAELAKAINKLNSNITNLQISLKKLSAISKADYVELVFTS